MNKTQNLHQLMEDTASEMEKLGYSKSSMRHYHEVWNRYLKYTVLTDINRHDMEQFLFECYGISADTNLTTRYQRSATRAMNVLAYYAEFEKIYIRFPLAKPLNVQTPFDSILFGFTAMLKESGYADSTIHTHERIITRFLQFLRDDDVQSVQDISTANITSFILEITGHRGKVSYLPSVWSVDDVQSILQCIDTGNPVGKRDYAMILLAIRLGLRGSDIKSLKFHDIDWDKETITVVQSKTKEPVALPLLVDVGMALVDYLRNSRPISDLTFPCTCCGGTMRRVPEVLDCWFESGSVPFAQKHYPFENKEWFESHFPCDFIVEYTGQIRCWFYYLHVLAVALFDKPAFQNCIVHGTILAKDGKKLSKSSKNYTDPMELMKSYGTDAFRLYLYQTNAMLIGDLLFDESGIQEAYQQILLPYWNACNFYISYANIDLVKPDMVIEPKANDQLDKWILAKLYRAVSNITENMDHYQVNKYVDELTSLVDGLTNWYIRRSRRRFWSNGMSSDKKEGYETLYYVLVNITKLFAPVAPLMAEKIYKTLTPDFSVHLADWPTIPDYFRNDELLEQVEITQKVIYLSRTIRSKNRIKNRQPLSELKIVMSNNEYDSIVDQFKDIIAEELNVKKVTILENMDDVATLKYAPNFNEIRNRYPDKLTNIIQTIKTGKFVLKNDKALLSINNQTEEFDSEIVLVTFQAKDGQHIVSDSGIVVSLDLEITEELKREGIARDVIRNVQDARK